MWEPLHWSLQGVYLYCLKITRKPMELFLRQTLGWGFTSNEGI